MHERTLLAADAAVNLPLRGMALLWALVLLLAVLSLNAGLTKRRRAL
jgi:hypothetical protein